jgi:hypothetical protein
MMSWDNEELVWAFHQNLDANATKILRSAPPIPVGAAACPLGLGVAVSVAGTQQAERARDRRE